MPVDSYWLRLTPIDGIEGPGLARPGSWPNQLEPGRRLHPGRQYPRRVRVSGSAIRVVSTPSRQGQWALHPRRQYPIAPGSVGVPSASSVPQCARVRGRTSESEPPVGPPPGQRAQLAPQLEPTAGRVTYCTNAQTNELGQDDSSEQARWPRERACGPHARAGGPVATPGSPAPARDSDDRPPPHHQPARSKPDPGPCLRLWGLWHLPMRQ